MEMIESQVFSPSAIRDLCDGRRSHQKFFEAEFVQKHVRIVEVIIAKRVVVLGGDTLAIACPGPAA